FSTRGYGNAALRARRDASSTFRDVGGNWRRLVGTGENALSAASLMSLSSLRSLLGFPARLVPWPPIRARFRDGGARPGWPFPSPRRWSLSWLASPGPTPPPPASPTCCSSWGSPPGAAGRWGPPLRWWPW